MNNESKLNCQIKKILKDNLVKLTESVKDMQEIKEHLHPNTMTELTLYTHQIQNLYISEYARFTKIKDELELY